ncbi:MAG: hypothetical protein V4582_17855 [Pseudomonadota bacterium]
MWSIAVKRGILIAWFALGSCDATGKGLNEAPTILKVPVIAIRYEVETSRFDALPSDVTDLCEKNREHIRSRFSIFAMTRDAARTYYLVGGYEVRTHPEPPELPRYEVDDFGSVIFVEGNRCVDLGEAALAFEYIDNDKGLSQLIVEQLARDFAVRLERGFGGKDRLRTELRNHHVDFKRLTPEMQKALNPYFLAGS